MSPRSTHAPVIPVPSAAGRLLAVLAVLLGLAAGSAAGAQVVIQERVEVDPGVAVSPRSHSGPVAPNYPGLPPGVNAPGACSVGLEGPTHTLRYGDLEPIRVIWSDGCGDAGEGNSHQGQFYDTWVREAYGEHDGRVAVQPDLNPSCEEPGCLAKGDSLYGIHLLGPLMYPRRHFYYYAGAAINEVSLFGYIWDYREQGDELGIPVNVDVGLRSQRHFMHWGKGDDGGPGPVYFWTDTTNTVTWPITVLPPWLESDLGADSVSLSQQVVLRAVTRDAEGPVEIDPYYRIQVSAYPVWIHPDDPEPAGLYDGGGGRFVNTRTGHSDPDFLVAFYSDFEAGNIVYEAPSAEDLEGPPPSALARRGETSGPAGRAQGALEDRADQLRTRLLKRGVAADRAETYVRTFLTRRGAGPSRRGSASRTMAAGVLGSAAEMGEDPAPLEVYFDFFDADYIYEWASVTVTEPRFDLIVDSDNDGRLTASDEAAEYADDRVGALLALNDDDDDEDDVADLDGPGGVDDDDLEKIEVRGPTNATAEVTLEAVKGADDVRVWTDRSRSTEVELPHTASADELPLTYFVEGVQWSDTTAVLRAAYSTPDAGGTLVEVAADTARVYVGPTSLSAPTAFPAGDDVVAVVTGFPAGTALTLRTSGGSAGTQVDEVDMAGPALVYTLPIDEATVQAGGQFKFEVRADGGRVSLDSGTIRAEGAAPDRIELDYDENEWTRDPIIVRVRDARGEHVGPGVPFVVRVTDHAGSIVSSYEGVTNVVGNAFVKVDPPPSDSVMVQAFAAPAWSDPVRLVAQPVTLALSVSSDSLDVHLGETATATLTTSAAAGTEVEWEVTNQGTSAPVVFTTSVDYNGTAAATVESAQSALGYAVVSARVAGRGARKAVRTYSTAPLSAEVVYPVLAGDAATSGTYTETLSLPVPPALQDSLGYTTVERAVEAPVEASTEVIVRGEADASYSVEVAPEHAAYVALDGTANGTVTADGAGRASFTIRSLGLLPGGRGAQEIRFTVEPAGTGPVAARRRGTEAALQASADGDSTVAVTGRIYLAPQSGIAALWDRFVGSVGSDFSGEAGYRAYLEGSVNHPYFTSVLAVLKNDVKRWASWEWDEEWFRPFSCAGDCDYVEYYLQGGNLALYVLGSDLDDLNPDVVEEWRDAFFDNVTAENLRESMGRVAAISGFTADRSTSGSWYAHNVAVAFGECTSSATTLLDGCFGRLVEYTEAATALAGYVRYAGQVVTGPTELERAMLLHDELGGAFESATDALVREHYRGRDGLSVEAGAVLLDLVASDAPLRAELAADSNATQHVERVARATEDGRLDPALLKALFGTDAVFDPATHGNSTYSRLYLVEDLFDVGRSTQGEESQRRLRDALLNVFRDPGNVKGGRFELVAAAYLAREAWRGRAAGDPPPTVDIGYRAKKGFRTTLLDGTPLSLDSTKDATNLDVRVDLTGYEVKFKMPRASFARQFMTVATLADHVGLDTVYFGSSAPDRPGRTREGFRAVQQTIDAGNTTSLQTVGRYKYIPANGRE